MFDALSNLIEMVGMIIDFAISLVTGLIDLIAMFPSVIKTFTSAVGLLPGFVVAFSSITITLSVVFMITGRQSGGGGK